MSFVARPASATCVGPVRDVAGPPPQGCLSGVSGQGMDRFVSNFTNRLDAKGRVSIPAPFRAVLARDGFEGLYVHPTLDSPALDAGGHRLLSEIDAFLSTLSPYSDERDQLSTALFGTSEILKVDTEGREPLIKTLRGVGYVLKA